MSSVGKGFKTFFSKGTGVTKGFFSEKNRNRFKTIHENHEGISNFFGRLIRFKSEPVKL
jgi:hypothetical protein